MEKGDDLMDDSSSESEKDDSNNLSSIFNDPYATPYTTDDGKKRWRCEWCKKDFALWNATKALSHLVQKRKEDIAPCRGKIDQESKNRYLELYNKKKRKTASMARKRDLVVRGIEGNNTRAAISLESSKRSTRAKQTQALHPCQAQYRHSVDIAHQVV